MTVRIVLVVAGLASGATNAASEPRSGNVRFVYAAPEACPLRSRFESAVRSRIDEDGSTTPTTVSLSVVAHDGMFESQLAIDRAGSTISRRTLADKSCEPVIDALALIAALALNASTEPAPAPVAVAPAPRATARTTTVAIGVDSGTYQGVAPDPAFGGELYVEGVSHADSVVQPSVRIGAALAGSATTVGSGRASFVWFVGELGACPLRFALGYDVAISPCTRLDVGALHASGSGVGPAMTATRRWVAPSALARLSWQVQSSVMVELEGGVLAPLERDRYFFPPSATIFQVPAVAAVGRAGVSARF